ncbi:MAG: hypothetical protein ACHQDE_09715, partial [Acidimicrobiia bacterium]
MNSTIKEVLNDDGFRAALVSGVILAGLTWLLARRGRSTGYALAAVVATLIGFRAGHRLPAALVVALVLLAVGEWLAARGRSWLVRFAVMVPGAFVLAASLPDGIAFRLQATVFLATIVAAPLVVVTAARDPRLAAALFAVAAVGVYVCVP